ncbi:hypothetical protein [Peromfec virus RodF7_7]|uniref:Uncharacterized protein n=1 Tax=Peromfec virus RodF7_7 TaxID=2929355 RepID=A0A976N242_9VIRU|nr:hypothetical protein [Peromfec virus RodF7_7]
MRKYIHVIDTTQRVSPADSKVVKTYVPNGLEDFQFEEVDGVLYRHTDVGIIFNQERLKKLNPMALDTFVQNLKKQSPNPDVSDDVLKKVVKSRYCQSITDIQNYSRAIEREFDSIMEQAKTEQERAALAESLESNNSSNNSNTENNEE